jgi:hypothetical protein
MLSFRLSEAQLAALSPGAGRVRLEGAIEVREAREVARLPLERGAAVARNGNRFRITAVRFSDSRPSLTLRHTGVAPADRRDDDFGWDERFDYAVVNSDRTEVIALHRIESSSTGLGFVVLGSGATRSTRNLGVREPREVPVDERWLDGARLLIRQWVPVGSYAVRAETVPGR